MLNKTAEKVLKVIIKKSNGNLEDLISISQKDFNDKKITNNILNSMCQQLKDEGYVGSCYSGCDETDDIDLILKYEGYSYFDNKKTKYFWKLAPIIISLIALLKSFQSELVLLLQSIMKLLK